MTGGTHPRHLPPAPPPRPFPVPSLHLPLTPPRVTLPSHAPHPHPPHRLRHHRLLRRRPRGDRTAAGAGDAAGESLARPRTRRYRGGIGPPRRRRTDVPRGDVPPRGGRPGR